MTEIKCIIRLNQYAMGSRSHSELYGEDKDRERRQPLMQRNRQGYNSVLTVSPQGFTLTAGKSGEVIRRGTDTDVFEIYDSLLFKADPLYVVDEVKGVELPYSEYEQRYGFDRVGILREKPARFRVFTKESKGDTAIGIERYHNKKTLAIYSIYEPYPMTKKEKAKYIADYIYPTLAANEFANISATGLNRYLYPDIRIYGHSDKPTFDIARELYDDAKERGTTISEDFREGEDK